MINYSKTLNLPSTDFKMQANLKEKEIEILKFWENINIYSQLRKLRKGKNKFILHDGPPYPNGDVHLGTAFNKFLKDIIIKYKSMKDLDAPFIPGWDCHGLPVEHIVSEKLKQQKEKISQVEIRKRCKDFALYYVNIQKEQFKRLGVFGDWEKPYLTLSFEYESKIIAIFEELVKKKYIYRGLRPIFWCFHCETVLAEAEVEYENYTSPSIYLKFEVIESKSLNIKPNTFILIWTTTPWTLLGNVAITCHPDFQYVVIESSQGNLILSYELLEIVSTKLNFKNYKIINSFAGREIEGVISQHPLIKNRKSPVILGDHVTKEIGTGCVHTAPGHGLEDYIVGLRYNLPILTPVDEKGNFTQEAEEFAGINVFDANKLIIEKLRKNGYLLHDENYTHFYPHCWRCKNPLIFRAIKQWFFDLNNENLREKVLEVTKKIKWIPAWGEEKFFQAIVSRPDWCISRQRSWGIPIPSFYCKNCQEVLLESKIIFSIRKMIEKEGVDIWFKKEAKDFLPYEIKCKKCGCNNFEKEKDILDVWFESGVSFAAVLETKKELNFPADVYLEAVDQHRGWFQSSILPSMATRGKPPYKMVITHGLILDLKGKKMSKSKGNIIAPQEIIEKYGADILRLYFASINYTTDTSLLEDSLTSIIENYRKIRNTFRFLLSNLKDFNPKKDTIPYNKLFALDKWMLYQLSQLINKVTISYENFEFHHIYTLLVNFCISNLSNFYLDISKDTLYILKKDSLKRRSTQTVFYEILISLVKLIAPILSFTSEEIWRYILKRKKDIFVSVHLSLWPKTKKIWEKEELVKKWEVILNLREKVFKILEEARQKKIIKHSLDAKVIIYSSQKKILSFIKKNYEILKEIFIISELIYKKKEKVEIEINIEKSKGKKCVRCWHYSSTIGENKEHPLICERCIEIIR